MNHTVPLLLEGRAAEDKWIDVCYVEIYGIFKFNHLLGVCFDYSNINPEL